MADSSVPAIGTAIEHMRRRGPDSSRVWDAEGVVLGHCRLSIIDLDERAAQPMFTHDGRYAIVFNGEIYNYAALRQELLASGVKLRTTSDTEVLLELFVAQGEKMLPRLRGMFAFAIWDSLTRELFLARDSYGIKPLYYAQTVTGFLFCSQVKALIATGLVPVAQETAALVGFYLWGNVPEPWTMYRDVYALSPGHWLKVTQGRSQALVSWKDIRAAWQQPAGSATADELRQRVSTAVAGSVRAHLVSDVPVCTFLSGGIDSATVAALAVEADQNVEGITIGFEEYLGTADDEIPNARESAQLLGIAHTVRVVSKREFDEDFGGMMHAMDQPSIDGFNTWFASKAAAERGFKVALSGIGGDELFAGYPSFERTRSARRVRTAFAVPGAGVAAGLAAPVLARLLRRPKLAAIPAFIGTLEGQYFLSRGLFLPSEIEDLVGIDVARDGMARLGGTVAGLGPTHARSDIAAIGQLESTVYLRNQLLRDCDWASMAHSLELRTPLVDAFLLDELCRYTELFGRGAGKEMLAGSPNAPVPESIRRRPKTGFTLPMSRWTQSGRGRGVPWARDWARLVGAEYSKCV